MNQYFNVSRFWKLLKLELFLAKKAILLTLLLSFGVILFAFFLLQMIMQRPEVYDHTDGYVYTLLIGGFVLSSLSFSDAGSSLSRLRFLMLPVSALERFVCMWLLTSVGWLIGFTLIFILYIAIANPIGQLLFSDVQIKPFDPLGNTAHQTMMTYLVLQSLFLLGAAHFRGYAFLKTAGVIILILLVAGALVYIMLKTPFVSDHRCTGWDCDLLINIGALPAWKITKWIFWYALAPAGWVLTFLGLKDQEA